MAKYIEHVNSLFKNAVGSSNELIVYGQNVSAGSRIGGLTRGFTTKGRGKIINMTNSENSLVGFGFGLMLGNGQAAFFMKQLDFLFLGIDQIVNTYNIFRNAGHAKGSFTIVPTIVDIGYQGPHSSSNNFGDFCSMARISGYAVTNKYDAECIIRRHFIAPGFRIIGVSQRLFNSEVIDPGEPIIIDNDLKYVQYRDGQDVTIVCFNFSFPYGWQITQEMEKVGTKPSLFNINYMTSIDWKPIIKNICQTKKLILIDDSQSKNLSCFSLMAEARATGLLKKEMFLRQDIKGDWLNPISKSLNIDYMKIARSF